MARVVVDCETLLRARGDVRCGAAGWVSAAEGRERVQRTNSLKVRFLGDKVLQA